jgi:hypothetical protein
VVTEEETLKLTVQIKGPFGLHPPPGDWASFRARISGEVMATTLCLSTHQTAVVLTDQSSPQRARLDRASRLSLLRDMARVSAVSYPRCPL